MKSHHPQPAFSCVLLLAMASLTVLNSPAWCAWAKEMEVTNEWQLLGENDTIPAGMHIRMDMTTGEKWVKLLEEEDEELGDVGESLHGDIGGSQVAAVAIDSDGSVQVATTTSSVTSADEEVESVPGSPQYDYEMMHRTLSNLPDDEKERMGGIPELPPDTSDSKSRTLTSKERQAFERRMAEIWERRQEELKEVQEMLMDLPEVLKQRIQGIKEYLLDPAEHLMEMDLDEELPDGAVTHIVSLLQDLEFQLTDVDNARDFHTLGGWALLVSLISEDVHTENVPISKKSRKTEGKIRAVQSHAAWAIGSAVKNTGEFDPYAIEKVNIGGKATGTRTTALDLLLELFCKEHKDSKRWEIRTLLAKCIYAIGALLRGNRLSQAHLLQTNGAAALGDKLRRLALGPYSSSDAKLIQRLLSLASDVVSDIRLHGDPSQEILNNSILQAFTSLDWCDATSMILTSESLLPIPVQETLLESVESLAPHCKEAWKEKSSAHQTAVHRIHKDWSNNGSDFDPDHLDQLMELAQRVNDALLVSIPNLQKS